jgi:hypothetical protein
MAADKAPEDEMFGKKSSKADNFSRAHKKGEGMHKREKRAKMSESHGKGAKK